MGSHAAGAKLIALLGVPLDHNSSFLRGPSEAPAVIRRALRCGAANCFAENGVDIDAPGLLIDAGDVRIIDGDPACREEIEASVTRQLLQGRRVLALGGDHSITHPIMSAYAAAGQRAHILHFDAHPDLYDDFEGNPQSHASPFARIMERGLADGLTQIGIRTLNPQQQSQADRFGVVIHQMRSSRPQDIVLPDGPVYLSFDIDALDPAFAPGVSHHEPGGLSVREALSIIQRIPGPIVGADIVEYNPRRDLNGVTAMVAAKLLKEIVGMMAR
jgi:agmatinase